MPVLDARVGDRRQTAPDAARQSSMDDAGGSIPPDGTPFIPAGSVVHTEPGSLPVLQYVDPAGSRITVQPSVRRTSCPPRASWRAVSASRSSQERSTCAVTLG